MIEHIAPLVAAILALLYLRAELRLRRASADAALFRAQAEQLMRDLLHRRERRAQGARKGWATRRGHDGEGRA